ncbi:23S ribosomal RNA methyltransferase Erm [Kocuria coralli]|uniref:23S ribosomal RNA methyltransferase Erm n=1 Tax=Kocuria coralli TaxID=1461025 RepID=A0A5J5L0U5_9MICC|nr:23S ribosomal RNA methyltransferase Erm [Kocuria coralli]KAA9394815.1 23S ribosomal RNA methyltransferase Erm [Kocuria coralli]
MPRSHSGGRHELGQNFLTHKPTIKRIVEITAATDGAILEIGPGDGALTGPLSRLGRPLTAVEIDEHRVRRLRKAFPGARILHEDALRADLASAPVIVGNLPFHLTTPLLRRLLRSRNWTHAVVMTQWEVARKRAGVGGATMMTAQAAPWFGFTLHGRVPASGFRPMPSVDGGILEIVRRGPPLIPIAERAAYEAFVKRVFTGRGADLARILAAASSLSVREARLLLDDVGCPRRALPRDLAAEQWAELWRRLP